MSDVEKLAREAFLAQIPKDHVNWSRLHNRVADGSCHIHSDPLSFIAAMAIDAIKSAILAERERCAAVADAERGYRASCEAKATIKQEKRDFQSMKIALVQVAAAIRNQP